MEGRGKVTVGLVSGRLRIISAAGIVGLFEIVVVVRVVRCAMTYRGRILCGTRGLSRCGPGIVAASGGCGGSDKEQLLRLPRLPGIRDGQFVSDPRRSSRRNFAFAAGRGKRKLCQRFGAAHRGAPGGDHRAARWHHLENPDPSRAHASRPGRYWRNWTTGRSMRISKLAARSPAASKTI